MSSGSTMGRAAAVLLLGTCIPGVLAKAGPAKRPASLDVQKEPGVVAGLALPPLTTVESRDHSGETWETSGAIAGGLPVARDDFCKHFRQQGWTLDKVVPLDAGKHASELHVWARGAERFVLMLWKTSAGRSGFALGEMRQGQPGSKEEVGR